MVIKSLRKLFTRQDKKVLIGLLMLSIFVSVFETVGISGLMMFVTIATNFDIINKYSYFSSVYNFFNFSHPAHFIGMLGLALIGFYFVRALLNISLVYSLNNFAQMRQHRFSTDIFQRFLLLEYKDFTQRNSVSFSQVIFSYSGNATQVINGVLSITTESFTIIAIYAMLFYVNWKMTLVLSLLLSIKVFIIIKIFSGKIAAAGKQTQFFNAGMTKIFNETFGNYKVLKLLGDFEQIVFNFKKLNYSFARANNVNAVWQGLPRFILETIGFSVLIGVIVYVLFMYRNAQFVIPIVSMYALAFYRFLPSVNKILMGYNQIIFNKHVLEPLENYLHLPFEQASTDYLKPFNHQLSLHNISFAYTPDKPVIRSSSITIKPGEKIGFVGPSGAGKTTFVDILVGLLKPDTGMLSVDDQPIGAENLRSWRRMIGYIPQHIYLFDGTAAENVLCGRLRNEALLIKVLQQANMYEFLLDKGGIDIRVGEAGIQLSGGQRQRLAIARALYGNPPILVLDEATSSLDNDNEEFVMNEMYHAAQGRTMFIIAHRLSTIARCDRVFQIKDGVTNEISVAQAVYGTNLTEQKTPQIKGAALV